MQMTSAEIVREYRQAKDQKMQIGILADLNACGPGQIKKILQEAGEIIPMPPRKAQAPKERTIMKPEKSIMDPRPKEKTVEREPAPELNPETKTVYGHELPPESVARDYIQDLINRRNEHAAELARIDRELYAFVHMIADGAEQNPK